VLLLRRPSVASQEKKKGCLPRLCWSPPPIIVLFFCFSLFAIPLFMAWKFPLGYVGLVRPLPIFPDGQPLLRLGRPKKMCFLTISPALVMFCLRRPVLLPIAAAFVLFEFDTPLRAHRLSLFSAATSVHFVRFSACRLWATWFGVAYRTIFSCRGGFSSLWKGDLALVFRNSCSRHWVLPCFFFRSRFRLTIGIWFGFCLPR